MHRLLAMLMLLALTACAARSPLPPPSATSRDLAQDRVLVTLASTAPHGIAALSPSGRLEYHPPSTMAVREAQLAKAREIAEALDLVIEEDWPIPALDVHCIVFRFDPARSRDALFDRLAARPDVESVQPLQFFEGMAANADDDPLAGWDAALNERLRAAHERATGRDVTIAVIDAGLDVAHEDLQGVSLRAVDLVDGLEAVPPEMHGTAIVGVLAARPQNGIGIRGYAPDARILLARACWETDASRETTVCNSFTLAKAMSLALQSDADIVNMSIRGPRDPLLERLGAEIVRRGVLLVAAGDDANSFPASVPGSVTAARFASVSSGAPSLTLLPGDRYGLRNGTSITTARITGVAALLMQLQPALTTRQFLAFLHAAPAAEYDTDVAGLLHGALRHPAR